MVINRLYILSSQQCFFLFFIQENVLRNKFMLRNIYHELYLGKLFNNVFWSHTCNNLETDKRENDDNDNDDNDK